MNRNIQLKSNLISIKNQMKNISNNTLTKLIEESNISKSQSVLSNEIISASKYTNPKNRNYSESGMILCLLYQIRLDIFFTSKKLN